MQPTTDQQVNGQLLAKTAQWAASASKLLTGTHIFIPLVAVAAVGGRWPGVFAAKHVVVAGVALLLKAHFREQAKTTSIGRPMAAAAAAAAAAVVAPSPCASSWTLSSRDSSLCKLN